MRGAGCLSTSLALAPSQDIRQITRNKGCIVFKETALFLVRRGGMPYLLAIDACHNIIQRRGESDTDASFVIVGLRASLCRRNSDGVSR
jgi:hypothetical protein